MKNEYEKLSKLLSHALRHEPETYGLTLDSEGWAPLAQLFVALKNRGLGNVTESDIEDMIAQSAKKRHELGDGKIRAYYGHSVEGKIVKLPAVPPEILYHGTIADFLPSILEQGLLPMGRQYVHLSAEAGTAKEVAKRRKGATVLLQVNALAAHNAGVQFYLEDNGIWLAEPIAAAYLVEMLP